MNSKYTITVGSPLLRPGLTITTEVSEQYVVAVTRTLMRAVRHINNPAPGKVIHGSAQVKDAEEFRVLTGLPPQPRSGFPPRLQPQDHERPGDPE